MYIVNYLCVILKFASCFYIVLQRFLFDLYVSWLSYVGLLLLFYGFIYCFIFVFVFIVFVMMLLLFWFVYLYWICGWLLIVFCFALFLLFICEGFFIVFIVCADCFLYYDLHYSLLAFACFLCFERFPKAFWSFLWRFCEMTTAVDTPGVLAERSPPATFTIFVRNVYNF